MTMALFISLLYKHKSIDRTEWILDRIFMINSKYKAMTYAYYYKLMWNFTFL